MIHIQLTRACLWKHCWKVIVCLSWGFGDSTDWHMNVITLKVLNLLFMFCRTGLEVFRGVVLGKQWFTVTSRPFINLRRKTRLVFKENKSDVCLCHALMCCGRIATVRVVIKGIVAMWLLGCFVLLTDSLWSSGSSLVYRYDLGENGAFVHLVKQQHMIWGISRMN